MNPSSHRIDYTFVRRRSAALLFVAQFLASSGIFCVPVFAAVTESWVHRHRNAPDHVVSVFSKSLLDTAGNVIVVGRSIKYHPDAFSIDIVKFSGTAGAMLWRQSHPYPIELAVGLIDVQLDGSNNIVLIGYSDPGTGPLDYVTAKFSGNDGTLLWEKHHVSPSRGFGNQVFAVNRAGDVVVAIRYPLGPEWNEGSIAFCAFKYAASDGALVWEKCYTGPGGRAYHLEDIVFDTADNMVMSGWSISEEAANSYDIYTAKYSGTNGAILWEKRYNGPAKKDDYPTALAVDGSGNVIVTGVTSNSGAEGWDIYTAKYSSADGALLWEHVYNGPADRSDQGVAVTVDMVGNVVVTGASDNGAPRYDSDVYTAKYAAADGALVWEQRYTGPGASGDGPIDIAVDALGNVALIAAVESGVGQSTNGCYTAMYAAADGSVLWHQYFDGLAFWGDPVASIAADGDGNIVVTAVADTTGQSVGFGYDSEIYTAKYASADGALLWDEYFDSAPSYPTSAKAVAVDAAGNVLVTGSAFNPISEDTEIYTAKYASSDGRLIWEARYNDSSDDEATAMALDAQGNVVVTGWTAVTGGHDYYTAKYAAEDGSLLWKALYNGPANRFDTARAVAIDASGNVVVTGDSGNGTNGDILVIKYAAEDGTVFWEHRYSGPATNSYHDDRAIAMAVDGNGDIVIVGQSETTAGEEYYTAKHAGADGTLLWERRHNDPDAYDEPASLAVDGVGNVIVTGNSGTIKYLGDGAPAWTNVTVVGKAVALDSSGNIVVAGSCYNTNGNLDIYTAKIAASDGALLWTRCDNGPADGDDFATAVAVDTSGNMIVTGTTWNGTDTDYYTAKYAGGDGGLLWERLYNGPTNGEDYTVASHSLALGPNGMVAITGRSENSDGNTDMATVVYRENLPAVSIAQVSTGVHLRFVGVPGRRYRIERAPMVSGPWTTIATRAAPVSGIIQFKETNAPTGSVFYRTVQP